MLMLTTTSLSFIVSVALMTFISENVVFLTIFGAILLVILAVGLHFRKKNKKIHEVVHPVKEILGNVPERVAELNDEVRPFGFAYEPYQDIFYSIKNPWQRQLGYCRLYDEASAAVSMIIDSEPITFEYGGRKWLIEFWKGQYGMNTGGEVGIYYTTGPSLNIPGVFNGTFYRCPEDDECINMSFVLRKKGNILFTRTGYHWWLTGFKLGEFTKPSDLMMDVTLELYDKRMAAAFVAALQKVGYTDEEYRVQGARVLVRFNKPHTKQPITRTAFTDWLMQRNNESYCDAYNKLTSEYKETLDKLVILRNESPSLYNRAMVIGRPKEAFDSFDKIKGYIN